MHSRSDSIPAAPVHVWRIRTAGYWHVRRQKRGTTVKVGLVNGIDLDEITVAASRDKTWLSDNDKPKCSDDLDRCRRDHDPMFDPISRSATRRLERR